MISRDLVLIGGGHSHLAVLVRFGRRPVAGVRLTLVSDVAYAPYSGTLPGLIAGHYSFEEAHIDLRRLCDATGTRFVGAPAEALEPAQAKVRLAERQACLGYDLLSIDVGSTPPALPMTEGAHVIAVKPVAGFLAWLATADRAPPPRIGIVGAGAGGCELAMALRHRLGAAVQLIDAGTALLPDLDPVARLRVREALAAAGVELLLGSPATRAKRGELELEDGRALRADAVILASGAAAPHWPASAGLATDAGGFIRVHDTLRSVSHPAIFASGDVAAIEDCPLPRSGVYAVRQGPVLAANLRRTLEGLPLEPYRPQRRFLRILSLGGKRAVAARGGFVVEGDWVWRWKDRIDRRFVERYTRPPAMWRPSAGGTSDSEPMRCLGCGAKAPPAVLRVLAGQGLAELDDAAVLPPSRHGQSVQTIDFFPAPIDDPELAGRIAAEHALNDVLAMGAAPETALALVVLPVAHPRLGARDLAAVLAGARTALAAAGAVLLGGHTGEGDRLGIGFTVTGSVEPDAVLRKSGGRPGDRLLLTKPLGTGAVLAAAMRGHGPTGAFDAAVATMLHGNAAALPVLRAHGVHALTDVSGFGLGGHLKEMIAGSGLAASLDLARIPLLPGLAASLAMAIESTLAPGNREDLLTVAEDGDWLGVLADPQTSGPLLAAMPQQEAEDCARALREVGYRAAAVIGVIEAAGDGMLVRRSRPGAC